MMANVDLPVPLIPTSTTEALESKIRGPSTGGGIGGGVVRGVDMALETPESVAP